MAKYGSKQTILALGAKVLRLEFVGVITRKAFDPVKLIDVRELKTGRFITLTRRELGYIWEMLEAGYFDGHWFSR